MGRKDLGVAVAYTESYGRSHASSTDVQLVAPFVHASVC